MFRALVLIAAIAVPGCQRSKDDAAKGKPSGVHDAQRARDLGPVFFGYHVGMSTKDVVTRANSDGFAVSAARINGQESTGTLAGMRAEARWRFIADGLVTMSATFLPDGDPGLEATAYYQALSKSIGTATCASKDHCMWRVGQVQVVAQRDESWPKGTDEPNVDYLFSVLLVRAPPP